MGSNCDFSYWKKPWLKWLTLAVGLLQLPLLYGKIQDYNQVIHANIFSPESLSEYIMQQKFSCMVTIVIAVGFLGAFFIGLFARSKRSSDLAEIILLFGLAAILTAGMIIWGPAIHGLWLWVVILCLVWGVDIFTIFQFMKEKRK